MQLVTERTEANEVRQFLGVNSRAPATSLPTTHVRYSANVNFGYDIHTRTGYTNKIAAAGARSIASHPSGFFVYAAANGLFRSDRRYVPELLRADIPPGEPVVYEVLGDALWYMTRGVRGVVTASSHADGWPSRTSVFVEGDHYIPTAPIPFGAAMALLNGRLFVADDNFLFYSAPFEYGSYSPDEGYVWFDAEITLIAPTLQGLVVAADRTWLLSGAPTSGQMTELLPYGATRGSLFRTRSGTGWGWFSNRGLIVFDAQGVKNVTEEHLAEKDVFSAACVVCSQNGLEHVLVSATAAGVSPAAAADFNDLVLDRSTP